VRRGIKKEGACARANDLQLLDSGGTDTRINSSKERSPHRDRGGEGKLSTAVIPASEKNYAAQLVEGGKKEALKKNGGERRERRSNRYKSGGIPHMGRGGKGVLEWPASPKVRSESVTSACPEEGNQREGRPAPNKGRAA